jgi:hypothetical protein
VILAKKSPKEVDPRIQDPLKGYLKRSFGTRYGSFRLLDERPLELLQGLPAEMPLPGGESLRLTYRGNQGEFLKLSMEMTGLKTSIRIRDGGLFFQAGHKHQGGMLVLAISAWASGEGETPAVPRPDPRTPGDPEPPGKREIEPAPAPQPR